MPDPRPKISATSDVFVHDLFASPGNEHILLSFVNAVQENAGQPPVKETKVLNPFNPKTFAADKRSIIDIKAVAHNDRTFVIEFQVGKHTAFVNRTLYLCAKTYCLQLNEGDDYELLLPVITIILTRFLLFQELKKLHNTFWLTAQDDPEFVLTKDMQFHTLELVQSKLAQLPTIKKPLRHWLEFFYHSDKKSEAEMKTLLPANQVAPEIEEAYQAYLRFTQNEELRRLADERLIANLDFNTQMRAAQREGHAKGRAEEAFEREAKAVIRTLTKRFQSVPQSLEERIHAITDLQRLEKLADFAFDCKTLDEFGESLK